VSAHHSIATNHCRQIVSHANPVWDPVGLISRASQGRWELPNGKSGAPRVLKSHHPFRAHFCFTSKRLNRRVTAFCTSVTRGEPHSRAMYKLLVLGRKAPAFGIAGRSSSKEGMPNYP
jgi:hypothetical protein